LEVDFFGYRNRSRVSGSGVCKRLEGLESSFDESTGVVVVEVVVEIGWYYVAAWHVLQT
jgi:hypothetical protein